MPPPLRMTGFCVNKLSPTRVVAEPFDQTHSHQAAGSGRVLDRIDDVLHRALRTGGRVQIDADRVGVDQDRRLGGIATIGLREEYLQLIPLSTRANRFEAQAQWDTRPQRGRGRGLLLTEQFQIGVELTAIAQSLCVGFGGQNADAISRAKVDFKAIQIDVRSIGTVEIACRAGCLDCRARSVRTFRRWHSTECR